MRIQNIRSGLVGGCRIGCEFKYTGVPTPTSPQLTQHLVLVECSETGLSQRKLLPVHFVPMQRSKGENR